MTDYIVDAPLHLVGSVRFTRNGGPDWPDPWGHGFGERSGFTSGPGSGSVGTEWFGAQLGVVSYIDRNAVEEAEIEIDDGSVMYLDDWITLQRREWFLAEADIYDEDGERIGRNPGGITITADAFIFWFSLHQITEPANSARLVLSLQTIDNQNENYRLYGQWLLSRQIGEDPYPIDWPQFSLYANGNAFRNVRAPRANGIHRLEIDLINPERHVTPGRHVGILVALGNSRPSNLTGTGQFHVSGGGVAEPEHESFESNSRIRLIHPFYSPDPRPVPQLHITTAAVDEPLTRHDARQVRARHSTPRQVGRMRT